MKSRVRLLNLVVSSTIILLTVGATLVVLGIFNASLEWDIFGPQAQAMLYGMFGSCMALAAFGVAMTIVIAIQESVKDFKRFVESRTNQEAEPDAPRKVYAERMLQVLLAMAFLVGVCALTNHVVLKQRCGVFKRLSLEQVSNFEGKIMANVEALSAPPQNNVPRDLYDLIHSIDNLDFVQRTTLYVPDPKEHEAMWGYTAWRNAYSNDDGFARFFVAKDFEKAMRKALDGDASDLDRINARNEFIWYKVLRSTTDDHQAVIRIDGDRRQNFREYRLGS